MTRARLRSVRVKRTETGVRQITNGRQFPFSGAAYEATKHTLVLIALVFVLYSTKFYGPWHDAKDMYRVDAQPLFLIGAEG